MPAADKRTVARNWFYPVLLTGIILFIFFAVSLWFRIYLPYGKIFVGNVIKFASNDAYFQMYLVDNIVHNFPHLTAYGPYLQFPWVGWGIGDIHFFNWVIAAVAWIAGFGSPSQHLIDVVGVFFPAVLGALTIIPVYFIGKVLFGRWAGVIAAGIIAIIGGEFLMRSSLGYTDDDIPNTLLSTVAMLFLILAIKAASQKPLTFARVRQHDWATITKPLIYSLLAGLFLGFLVFNGRVALLFIFIVAAYFIIQFIIDHLRKRYTDYLANTGGVLFFVTAVMSFLVQSGTVTRISLIIAFLIPLVLSGISRLMANRIRPAFYPLALVVLGGISIIIVRFADQSLFNSMLDTFNFLKPAGPSLTTAEIQPTFFEGGTFTLSIVWENFTTSFFIGFLALFVLIHLAFKQNNAERNALIVWTLVILAATLGLRRLASFLVINMALLTGYMCWLALKWVGVKETENEITGDIGALSFFKAPAKKADYYQVLGVNRYATDKEVRMAYQKLVAKYRPEIEPSGDRSPEAEEKMWGIKVAFETLTNHRKRTAYNRSQYEETRKSTGRTRRTKGGIFAVADKLVICFVALVVFLIAFLPNISPSINTAKQVPGVPSDAWVTSLDWLSQNTPEPFGDPNYYYHLVGPGAYQYPLSGYGVLAWWDYGYWITRIGRRIPNANPGQDPLALNKVAKAFTSENESSANTILNDIGTKYVITNYNIATTKFYAISQWAGKSNSQFFEIYYVPQENGNFQPALIFHPAYYQSLAVRLFSFNGTAVTPNLVTVISWQEQTDKAGQQFKTITGSQQFNSYRAATSFVSDNKSANWEIVGTNAFDSPVPLEALTHYQMVYSTNTTVSVWGMGTVPEIKIFNYSR